ncbi:histidine kinase [Fodinicola feengrottensis]|uniref:histidine kinase n=1 Tax=Fodinicola feengrottensis TaxID=435914 RepID=UPI0013D17480|nr:histidine kinase [Fodinicola feengrottensis]
MSTPDPDQPTTPTRVLPSVEPGQPTGADQPTETAPLVARPAGRARGSASVPSFARQETVPQIVAPPRPPSILRPPPPYAPPPVPIGPGATRGTMYGTPTADGRRPRRRLLERLDSWLRGNPWLSDSILAIGMLLFVAPVSLVIAVSNDGMGVESTPAVLIPILILIVLVTHGVVVVRRVMPITALIVVTVALAIKVLITPVPFPSDLIFLLVTYSVCAYGRRPAGAIAFVLGIAGGLAETARFSVLIGYRMDQDPTLILLLVFIFMFIVAAVFASWGLGQFRRVRYAYFTTLEDRAERAEAEREERAARAVVEERNRIAREMHDVVAHSLAVIVSQAQGGQYAAKTKPERAQEVLGTIAETGRQALADMRGLLGVLRSNEPLNADSAVEVNRGPQPRLAELGDLLTRVRASGLHVRQDEEGHRKQLGPTAELAVYRLVQESLTNTISSTLGRTRTPRSCCTGRRRRWKSPSPPTTAAARPCATRTTRPAAGTAWSACASGLPWSGGSVHTGPRPGGGFQVRARLPYRPA